MEELSKELEEVKQKIADIEKKIEEKKVETGRWKPEEGDGYWFINSYGQTTHEIWTNNRIDKERYEIGNLFKIKKKCEFVVEKLKVIAELREYEELNREWNEMNFHYHIYYNYSKEKVDIGCAQIVKQNEIYFESREIARQVIDAVGENRIKKYYLGVENE